MVLTRDYRAEELVARVFMISGHDPRERRRAGEVEHDRPRFGGQEERAGHADQAVGIGQLASQREGFGGLGRDTHRAAGDRHDLLGDRLWRHGPRVFDVAGGDDRVEAWEAAPGAGRSRSLSRVVPKTRVRRDGGKQVRKVSASAAAEATLCAPSITSQGFWPSDLDPRRPLERGETANHVVARDFEARLDFGQKVEARQHDGDVVGLVRSEQRQRQSSPVAAPGLDGDAGRRSGAISGGTGGMSSYQKSLSISRSEHRRWRATRADRLRSPRVARRR